MGIADAFKNDRPDAEEAECVSHAVVSDEVTAMAAEIVALDARIRALVEEKKVVMEKLQPEMQRTAITKIVVGDDASITLAKVGDRRASKSSIVAQFGKAGEDFWNALPNQKREYITVVWKKEK